MRGESLTAQGVAKLVVDRPDGRDDGEDWDDSYQDLPGDADVSTILEATMKSGVGPRLHQHPYAETFITRRGSATFVRRSPMAAVCPT